MPTHEYVSYEEFGRKFFEIAVTEERVAAGFATVAGDEFEIGPIAQGPGGFARVRAKVHIQEPQVRRAFGEMITFAVRIPLAIDMTIDLRVDKPRFRVAGEINLRATARAAEPLLLIIDVDRPRPSDIKVNVAGTSLRAELLRIVAGVDAEICRFIAKHVTDQIDSPESHKAQTIDVAKELDATWKGI
ncbi:MAG TPA: hypothetical protein VHI10_13640 [Mycobacterium sp.]|nr:hypothetical protein [Mycobacterium sp.]